MKSKYFVSILLISGLLYVGCGSSARYDPPKSPAESLQSFDLMDGFVIEPFATEPEVMDPVDLVFDEFGRIYVVEMPDYPFKPEPGEGRGRIRQLIDDDKDGIIDRTIIFAEGISEATSVLPWKGGLLVAAAPYISYWKDIDADGKSDTTEIIFSGFFENNSEAQITNLTYGIDNWIYASNHGQGGKITYHRDPDSQPLVINGGDFRFRLDTDEFEVEAGPAQFGQAFNDRWHRFITQNSLHIRHVVIPWRYLDRHPHIPARRVAHNISDHEAEMFQATPPPYWRAERTRRRQEKYDAQGLGRKEYAEDYFTGCSGGTFYGGHSFPKEFYGNIFTGEVAGNLIHRDIVKPLAGAPTYQASRAQIDMSREFLISTDSWFRPAHFSIGPDGHLYVLDYYRQHIETPLSIPEDLKADMDFLRGEDMGRIYRIRPAGANKDAPNENISDLDGEELVNLLKHPNRWHRLTAQRLILERNDASVLPHLKHLLQQTELPVSRLHALYALDGLGAVNQSNTRDALRDSDAAVREHGLIMAEQYPPLFDEIVQCVTDIDDRVAFQAILSLGQFERKEVVEIFAETIIKRQFEPWFGLGILSSKLGASLHMAEALLRDQPALKEDEGFPAFVGELALSLGHRNAVLEIDAFLNLMFKCEWEYQDLEAILSSLEDGLLKSKKPLTMDPKTRQRMHTTTDHQIVWKEFMRSIDSLTSNGLDL